MLFITWLLYELPLDSSCDKNIWWKLFITWLLLISQHPLDSSCNKNIWWTLFITWLLLISQHPLDSSCNKNIWWMLFITWLLYELSDGAQLGSHFPNIQSWFFPLKTVYLTNFCDVPWLFCVRRSLESSLVRYISLVLRSWYFTQLLPQRLVYPLV